MTATDLRTEEAIGKDNVAFTSYIKISIVLSCVNLPAGTLHPAFVVRRSPACFLFDHILRRSRDYVQERNVIGCSNRVAPASPIGLQDPQCIVPGLTSNLSVALVCFVGQICARLYD